MGPENTTHDRKNPPLRVFLCHCSADKPAVRTLYERLKTSFVDPWLDEKKIKGGQDWDLEIRNAVNSSDVVVVCLSNASLTKEGYVQKEIRQALNVAEEKPDGTIFIIPLRLEECEVPERLKQWQWIDYFDETGYRKLLDSLVTRAEHLKRYTSADLQQLADEFARKAAVAAELGTSYAQEAERLRNADQRFSGPQVEMNFAAGDAFDRANDKLNALIAEVEKCYWPTRLYAFNAVQSAWQKFRELNAKFETAQYHGGSIQPLIYWTSMERTTIARIVELELEVRELRRRGCFEYGLSESEPEAEWDGYHNADDWTGWA